MLVKYFYEHYPWFVLSTTSLGVLIVQLNLGTLNVALPVVSQHFEANAFEANWILLSYLLVSTLFIFIFGQVSDIFGRRILYLAGYSIFTLSCLSIGFSANINVLIFFRIVQAIGAALIITNTTAILTDTFPNRLLGIGLGLNVLIASIGQLLGPTLGGAIARFLSWEWIFWFNVPIGFFGFLSGYFILKKDNKKNPQGKVDILGAFLFFISIGSLIFSLSEGDDLGWYSTPVLLGFLMFFTLLPAFIVKEHFSSSPLFDLKLFKNRSYTIANITTFLNSFSRTAVVLLMALLYQTVFNDDSFIAGLKVLPVIIGMVIMSPLSGFLMRFFSIRILTTLGLFISSIGLFSLSVFLSLETVYWFGGVLMFLVGAGFGLFLPPNNVMIMKSVSKDKRGMANGLRSMLTNLGQVFSTAIGLLIINITLPSELRSMVYSTSNNLLTTLEANKIINSFKLAFTCLLIALIIGIVLSWLRSPIMKEKSLK